eukprot:scaffold5445_cov140-Skeletonema_marinoi.AAC.1
MSVHSVRLSMRLAVALAAIGNIGHHGVHIICDGDATAERFRCLSPSLFWARHRTYPPLPKILAQRSK